MTIHVSCKLYSDAVAANTAMKHQFHCLNEEVQRTQYKHTKKIKTPKLINTIKNVDLPTT